MFHPIDLSNITEYCQNNPVGKMLPDAFYIHILALHTLDPWLQEYESRARTCTERSQTSALPKVQSATLVKFSTNKPKISYLLIFSKKNNLLIHTRARAKCHRIIF